MRRRRQVIAVMDQQDVMEAVLAWLDTNRPDVAKKARSAAFDLVQGEVVCLIRGDES